MRRIKVNTIFTSRRGYGLEVDIGAMTRLEDVHYIVDFMLANGCPFLSPAQDDVQRVLRELYGPREPVRISWLQKRDINVHTLHTEFGATAEGFVQGCLLGYFLYLSGLAQFFEIPFRVRQARPIVPTFDQVVSDAIGQTLIDAIKKNLEKYAQLMKDRLAAISYWEVLPLSELARPFCRMMEEIARQAIAAQRGIEFRAEFLDVLKYVSQTEIPILGGGLTDADVEPWIANVQVLEAVSAHTSDLATPDYNQLVRAKYFIDVLSRYNSAPVDSTAYSAEPIAIVGDWYDAIREEHPTMNNRISTELTLHYEASKNPVAVVRYYQNSAGGYGAVPNSVGTSSMQSLIARLRDAKPSQMLRGVYVDNQNYWATPSRFDNYTEMPDDRAHMIVACSLALGIDVDVNENGQLRLDYIGETSLPVESTVGRIVRLEGSRFHSADPFHFACAAASPHLGAGMPVGTETCERFCIPPSRGIAHYLVFTGNTTPAFAHPAALPTIDVELQDFANPGSTINVSISIESLAGLMDLPDMHTFISPAWLWEAVRIGNEFARYQSVMDDKMVYRSEFRRVMDIASALFYPAIETAVRSARSAGSFDLTLVDRAAIYDACLRGFSTLALTLGSTELATALTAFTTHVRYARELARFVREHYESR